MTSIELPWTSWHVSCSISILYVKRRFPCLFPNFLNFYSNLFFFVFVLQVNSIRFIGPLAGPMTDDISFFIQSPFLCLGVHIHASVWKDYLGRSFPSHSLLDYGLTTCCLEKCRPELHFKVGLESFSNNFLNLLRFILPRNICPFEMP